MIIITSSHLALKTVRVLFSWLLQQPADWDLHSLQEKPADKDSYYLQELISGFILFLKELFMHQKVYANLFFWTSKKYMTIYLSLDKQNHNPGL